MIIPQVSIPVQDAKASIRRSPKLRVRNNNNEEEKNKGKKKRILRVSTAGTEYVILGIENQEKIHYNMPVRTMLYDAVTYMDQLKRIAMESKNYDGWTADEFLEMLREIYEKSDSLNTYSGRIAQLVGIVVNDEKIYQMGKKEAEVIMCRATEELREEGRREERAKTEAERVRADKAEAEKNKAEAENELLKEEIKRLQDMINKNKEG